MSRVFSAVAGECVLGGQNNRVRAGRCGGTCPVVSAVKLGRITPWAAGTWG